MLKRVTSILLVLCLALALLPLSALAATPLSGSFGGNVTWTLDDSGTLLVSGTGDMNNYSANTAPWNKSRTAVKEIIIQSGVTSIGDYTFMSCDALSTVRIPDSVTRIGECAFGFSGLTNITIPNSITEIERNTFNSCTKLSGVNIPEGIKVIGSAAFYNCTSLIDITLPNSVTKIEQLAFDACKNLSSISIGDKIVEIGGYAFQDCESLTSFTIPKGISTIESGVFHGCTSLENISIPSSVTSVKGYAFADCNKLTDVYFDGNAAKWGKIAFYDGNSCLTDAAIHYGQTTPGTSTQEYTVSYNLDGGEGGPVGGNFTVGSTVTVPATAPTRSGYTFAGWSNGTTTYQAGQTFVMPESNVVLTAMWTTDENSPELSFVEMLTQYTLANMDAATRESIQNAIYNLLFKAQFRPSENKTNNISFGSYSKSLTQKQVITNYWPAKNGSGAAQTSIADAVLGAYNIGGASRGCYAYSRFASKYIMETIGSSTKKVTSAADLKDLIENYADPGEHIRIDYKHSVTFLGESSDRKGFYCSDYIESGTSSIRVMYYTYEDFIKSYKGIPIFLYDTNDGSYFSGTAKSVENIATKMILKIACPVEAVVTLGGEALNSRSVPNDSDTATASFGSVARDGETLIFELEHNEDYNIAIIGTGEGAMTVTLEYYRNENMIDRRTFISIPITDKTEIDACGFDVLGSFVLYVYPDGTEESEVTWGAGIGETVYAADLSYSSRYHEYPGDTIGTSTPNNPSTPSIPSNPGGWYPGNNNPPTVTHSISVPSVTGGIVSVSPASASSGSMVTVTATPDADYELAVLTVSDASGKVLELTDKGNGQYTFKMPNGQVSIDVEFKTVSADVPWNNPFVDVSIGDWYYDAVKFVNQNGLMNGGGNGLFEPDVHLSRAMLAQILYNKEGRPIVTAASSFSDVMPGAWYANAVTRAATKNIVGGYGNGLFGPSDDITREQFAVILYRYAGSPIPPNLLLDFTDAYEVSNWARDAIRWAVDQGILKGKGNGILDPTGKATRAEAAQMLKNYFGQ